MSTLLINTANSITQSRESLIGVGDDKGGILKNTDPEFIPKPSGSGIIDVVNNFSWYLGPKSTTNALNKVPRAYITERRQVLNSLISGAIYYLNVIAKTGKDIAGEDAINKMNSYLKAINESSSTIKSITDSIAGFKNQFKSSGDNSVLQRNNLLSLLGIYYTELTGFKYVLPYYGSMLPITNSWGSGGDSAVAGIVNSGMDVIDEISKFTNIMQPGVYIQKPKYYNFSDEGKSVTIQFPLFNTIKRTSQPPHQLNYELLWLLTFQNKPYKTSFAKAPPPKLYTVEIPGVCSMPYSYVSDLSIDFRGTTRQLSVSTPRVNGGSVSVGTASVPIPEAYVVSITFTSLLNDFANLMVGGAFNSTINNNIVTIGS